MVNELGNKTITRVVLAQSAGAVEYTDCPSAEGQDPPPQRVSWI